MCMEHFIGSKFVTWECVFLFLLCMSILYIYIYVCVCVCVSSFWEKFIALWSIIIHDDSLLIIMYLIKKEEVFIICFIVK
jgi:hypothetical protein